MIPEKIRQSCVEISASIQQGLLTLESYHKEIILVVDTNGILLGTVTDGDIRRGLLAGKTIESSLHEVMNDNPITISENSTQRERLDLMKRHRILQLPTVDDEGHVKDLILLSEIVQVDIPLSDTNLGDQEILAIKEVLNSGWLSMGDVTRLFEERFAEMTGSKHAVAVANGTAALHIACSALELGPGDEVLCPSLSFVATSNAALYTGAKPVFCEVSGPDDLTIDPSDIAKKITSKTKAITVMHYGGYPCNMPLITQIANEYGLYLIEDAAHAPGARIGGRSCGNWGDVGCFSFFANKNMTTGEGGMLTTNSDELMEKFRLLRSHGMTSLTLDRHRGRAFSYDVIELGYNYRLDEMRSALGLVQLEKLHEWNEKRRNLVCKYRSLLQNIPHIRLPFEAINVTDSACHIMPILLDEDINRQRVMSSLRERGVQTSIHYPAIHKFSYYRDLYPTMSLPISEGIAAQELTLPLFPTMDEEQVENVVNALRASVEFENASMSNFVSG